jgi:glycosyltransferase involved in cell wall biosynthesis
VLPTHPNIQAREIGQSRGGGSSCVRYLRFALEAVWVWLRWRPHWVYASDLLACPVALLLSYLPGTRVLYHEHDEPAAGGQWLRRNGLLLARRLVARRARLCIVPNEQRIARFRAAVRQPARRIACVWNCPEKKEAVAVAAGNRGEKLRLHYHGNLSWLLLPRSVLKAIAILNGRVELQVVGYETLGHAGYGAELRRLSDELGIQDDVRLLGAMPRQRLLETAREADVGLSIIGGSEDPNLLTLVGASNKPFDYMACGLALLVANRPEWREMYVDPGYGMACDPESPAAVAAILRRFLDDREETRAMGERGRRRITEDWNYETQFDQVLRDLVSCQRSETYSR